MIHLDYNRVKLPAIRKKYGNKVKITDPGLLGSVMLTSECDDFTAADIVREFELELLDDYMHRSRCDRKLPGHMEP